MYIEDNKIVQSIIYLLISLYISYLCSAQCTNFYDIMWTLAGPEFCNHTVLKTLLETCHFKTEYFCTALFPFLLQVRFSRKRTKMRAQANTKKIEELTTRVQVLCWGSFLTPTWSSGLVQTLWMSEKKTSKVPVLKQLVVQTFLYGLELSFLFSFEKT